MSTIFSFDVMNVLYKPKCQQCSAFWRAAGTPRPIKIELFFHFSWPGKETNELLCLFIMGVLVKILCQPKMIEFLQVVGIEGHNPSGHCMIVSKILDSIPVSSSADVDMHPSKKQAQDEEFQSDSSHKLGELSLVCMLFWWDKMQAKSVCFLLFYIPPVHQFI